MSLAEIELAAGGRRWRADLGRGASLAIPLDFSGPQPAFFGAAPARSEPLREGGFVGDVNLGGSCRCATHTLTPHCNGTHTECIGHVVTEAVSVHSVAPISLQVAQLLSVTPVPAGSGPEHSVPPARHGDRWITAAALEAAAATAPWPECTALIVRTLPNPAEKRRWQYDVDTNPAPYFSNEAMQWIVSRGILHLVVDLPSLDRAADAGRLNAHRIFWGLPPGGTALSTAHRPHATVTELAYIDESLADGLYLLNLQLAPFVSDASPCRPIVYPLASLA